MAVWGTVSGLVGQVNDSVADAFAVMARTNSGE